MNQISMPANGEKWSCNKPITDEKVRPGTTCTIACLAGHDKIKGILLKLKLNGSSKTLISRQREGLSSLQKIWQKCNLAPAAKSSSALQTKWLLFQENGKNKFREKCYLRNEP